MINETYFAELSLREEILLVTHRWPVIVIFCLMGSLVGGLVSLGLPSPHRATKELYVGLNVYQISKGRNVSEHAGLQFSNPNDYKNWQMANLNSLIMMDAIVSETLERLRSLDPYWLNLDQDALAKMLHAYWRNAGKWRLVAENANPKYASQAVLVWEEVVVNHVHEAIDESQNLMLLDSQLQSLALTQAQVIARTAGLTQIRDSLTSWQVGISQQSINLPMPESDRMFLKHQVEQANLGTTGQQMLDSFPSQDVTMPDYITWLQSVVPLVDQEIQNLHSQIAALEDERNKIATMYADASRKSLGLSANLQVDKITTTPPEYTVVRPTGSLVLIGALLGLITWTIYWLTRISLQARKLPE